MGARADGQWYLHLFAAEQPDLNWESQEVCDDFLRTLRFWSDRDVDGFRVDVAHGLAKDMGNSRWRRPIDVVRHARRYGLTTADGGSQAGRAWLQSDGTTPS